MEASDISSIVKKRIAEKQYTHPHRKDIFKFTRHHDRHFNRGIVFENEELRLRTIEMNAELEREVSHVKKLRKENEKLKHDIWWLRDEYGRLEEGVRALGLDADELKMEEKISDDENNEHFESLEGKNPSSANLNSETDSNWKEAKYNGASYESLPQHSFATTMDADNIRFSNLLHNQEIQLYATIEKKSQVCNTLKPVCKDVAGKNSESKEENISFLKPSTNFSSMIARSCFSCTSFIPCLNLLSLDDPMFAGMSTYDIVRYFEDCEVGINTEYIQNAKKENCFKEKRKECINSLNEACASSIKLQNKKYDDQSEENVLTYFTEPENLCRIHVEKQHDFISNNATSFASKQTSIIYLNKTIDMSEPQPVAKKTSDNFAGKIVVEAKPFYFDVMNLSNPHTVVFSIENHPTLHHITIEEIIDELEAQFRRKNFFYCVQGVRILFPYIYVTFVSETGVLCFMNEGFRLKGVNVSLIDASFDTVLLKISGVPNFVSDGTLKILLCAFCIPVSEVRRIYYKGVDTGQRIFRMKPKSGITCPSSLIIGGSKIRIETLHPKNLETKQLALNNGKADSNQGVVDCYSCGTVSQRRNKISAYLENKATNFQSLLAWNSNDREKKSNSQVNSTIPYPPNLSRWSVPKTNIVKCPFSLSSEILFSPNNERIRANTTPSIRRNLENPEVHNPFKLQQNISADVLPKDFISRTVCIRQNSHRIQKINDSDKKNKDSTKAKHIDMINESRKQTGSIQYKTKSAMPLLTKKSEKSDAVNDKKGKNRIADDIPWCGCWGNGCF